ncbi:helix-turn-helix domain-containing protein [Streptantibioticus cattleyicolor]|uniref:Transcriptional regulator, AraC family n=1 Tax=Streptantibioticus cattleyicolor (strain ATCC 35852 / DSM 46488 / JCM 4925 / NBRC 14057 / NRRL 8057) TaxID=1003195 RepID=F8JLA3_STREN|nr:AraC family transcriptional regulator [Streptantibioticus cattleyicolor]AEW99611.1 transcriptional regulator, AraC family [Streptantibioticus cattleyicolor NRRL 8057 = DSM 46488]CCB71352.1 Transcriptional regulator containing an amidase domain and an AraC-type DNA-binding HTH domain [Streptantibioticus cattleyicolor NRRL 8057 = DSM 46488]
MFDSSDFDLRPYEGFDMAPYVRRTYCSWNAKGWRSLLVQRFDHAANADGLELPGTADLHLVLVVAGRAELETRADGGWRRHRWVPGRLELVVPGRPTTWRYRATTALRSVQAHIPYRTVERAAERMDGAVVDYERMAAAVAAGDPVVAEVLSALGSADETSDLYAESAAAFLTAHLLTRGRTPAPAKEDGRVGAAIALMRDRLAEPVTLADLAAEAHLSPYHFLRVFKATTGQTPHRFLTRLRIEAAQRLLVNGDLTVAEIARRCGFGSPGALSASFLRHTGMRPSDYRKS